MAAGGPIFNRRLSVGQSAYPVHFTAADYTIKVKVSFTDDRGNNETLTSAATATVVAKPNIAATGSPTVSGTAEVGQTLTASTSSIQDSDGLTNVSYSYQWVRNDGGAETDISEATESTYTLVDDDRGKTITVRVSFTDDRDNDESLISAATATVAAKFPNVVLILADDLGWGDIKSHNPDSVMTTPHIDSIAAGGVKFSDAHSPSSVCSPTRYGLLTGRYAWRSWLESGVLSPVDRPMIGKDVPTLGTLLQAHGYSTAAIGKWHLGMDFVYHSDPRKINDGNHGIDFDADLLDSPIDHGFEKFFGMSANLNWRPRVFIRDRRFAANWDTQPRDAPGVYRESETLTHLTAEAVSYIEQEGPTADPFFLYLPLHAVHKPHVPGDAFKGATGLGKYADFLAEMDWTVGQVLGALERTGVTDDTLVVFSSDNGGYVSNSPNHVDHSINGPWRGGKNQPWEGGHRVPLLMKWPNGLPASSTIDVTVSLTDLYATFAELVGEEVPTGTAPDSISLLPILAGDSTTRGQPLVHHYGTGVFVLRDGPWKLLFGRGAHTPDEKLVPWGKPWLLYNLDDDPGERNNIAADHPEVMERMEAAVRQIIAAEDDAKSSEASLRSLRVAGVDVGHFDSDVHSYEVYLDRDIRIVEVSAIPVEIDARLFMRWGPGQNQWRDRGRSEVPLANGTTTITVRVRPPDKSGDITYTLKVKRSQVTLKGIPQVGRTLTADTSTIADADGLDNVSYSYQWLADDAAISGATGSTYLLTASELGKAIKVKVSFTDDEDNAESLTSSATVAVAIKSGSAATGAPRITGTAQVGQTLTADTSGITDEDGLENVSYSYQWVRSDGSDDMDISGETGATYTLVPADLGMTIKVTVSFTDDEDNAESLTSAATETVTAKPNTAATGAPTISGDVQVGETLTADTSGINDADGLDNVSYSYQWVSNDGADDTDVNGATGGTYTLVDDDEGKTVKVRVSFTDDEDNAESLTSAATATVAAKPDSEDNTEDGDAWVATMTAGLLLYGHCGYSDFDGATGGSLTTTGFSIDGATYTVLAMGASGWMYITVDGEIPTAFTIEVDRTRLDSSDASLSSYSYGKTYEWQNAGINWSDGETVELRLELP